jgi:hypothetical protein
MSLPKTAETKAEQLWADLKADGHHLAERAKEILDELRGDAPKLEAEAAADAADVAHTAETQGVQPAIAEAEHDGVTLAEDTGHDVAAAVEGPAKTETAPTEAPASEPTA